MNGNRKPIDWDEVRRQIDERTRALERSMGGDERELEAAYRRRAAQLAARPVRTATAAPTAATVPMLIFALGAERYALPLSDLMAVLPFADCTPLPGALPELLGVINVRGEIRSVLDLRRLLELPEDRSCGSGYLLLVSHRDRVVALRVDQLEKVVRVALEALVIPCALGTALHGGLIKGLTPDRLIVLDTEAVLDHPIFHSPTYEE